MKPESVKPKRAIAIIYCFEGNQYTVICQCGYIFIGKTDKQDDIDRFYKDTGLDLYKTVQSIKVPLVTFEKRDN